MKSGNFRSSYRPARVAVLFFLVVALFFYGSLVWTGVISMTNSKLLPVYNFVGFDQYSRLWSTDRWIVSLVNMVIFGVLYIAISMGLGIFLAILLDRNVRGRGFSGRSSSIPSPCHWSSRASPGAGSSNPRRGCRPSCAGSASRASPSTG